MTSCSYFKYYWSNESRINLEEFGMEDSNGHYINGFCGTSVVLVNYN